MQRISLFLIFCFSRVHGVPLHDFYPFNVCPTRRGGGPCSESEIPNNSGDEDGYRKVALTVGFPFFSKTFHSLYVNTNGVISFSQPVLDHTSRSFPLANEYIISPYWADVDITGTGRIFYYESRNDTLLERVTKEVHKTGDQTAGVSKFKAKWIFIATWDKVGYYSAHADLVNTFQVLLVTDGLASFVLFNYLDDGIQWTTGDASGGEYGFGGTQAQMGFNFGHGGDYECSTSFAHPVSQTFDVISIATLSNTESPGQFVYRIDNCVPIQTCGNYFVEPEAVSLASGGCIKVIGCFDKSVDSVTCKYYDASGTSVAQSNGQVRNNRTAVCPLPLLLSLGQHTVKIEDLPKVEGTFSVVSFVDRQSSFVNAFNGEESALYVDKTKPVTLKWNITKECDDCFEDDDEAEYSLRYSIFRINAWVSPTIRNLPNKNFGATKISKDDLEMVRNLATRIIAGQGFRPFVLQISKKVDNFEVLYASPILPVLDKDPSGSCVDWFNSTKNESVTFNALASCTCSEKEAIDSNDYVADPTCSDFNSNCKENIKANRCYLSKGSSNAGQQCCYDTDGDLITTPRSGGSADLYHPVGGLYLRHLRTDYFPYVVCCAAQPSDDDMCKEYYKFRPSSHPVCSV